MPSRHQLYLEIPDLKNTQILRIVDISVYSTALSIKCPTLEISAPGYTTPYVIDVTSENFTYNLNACDIGLLNSGGCDTESPNLPDGLYTIRYSVSPNDKVYVEYKHLRISNFMKCYATELDNLELTCCYPSSEIRSKLSELQLVRDYLDAAKIKIEIVHDCHKGIELFHHAQVLMDRYTNKCTNC